MNGSIKRSVIAGAVILVAWLVVMFTCRNILMSPVVFGLSLVFGVLAFAAFAIALVATDRRVASHATTEVSMLPVAFSWGYFVVALIANTYFCLAAFAWIGTTLPVVVNVVLLAVLIIVQMGLNANARSTDERVARVAAKVNQTAQYGSYVGQLLAVADDPQLKAELKALKDDISFSSNMTQPHVQEIERQFMTTLESAANSMGSADAPEVALGLVRDARRLWKKRNAALTAIK